MRWHILKIRVASSVTSKFSCEKEKQNPHSYFFLPMDKYTYDFSFLHSFNKSVPSFILIGGKHLFHFNSYPQAGWHCIIATYISYFHFSPSFQSFWWFFSLNFINDKHLFYFFFQVNYVKKKNALFILLQKV